MSIARKIGNLGTALDSAALSTFLSKGTTDGEFDTIAWGDVTGKPSYIDSSLATQLFDSAYVQLRQSAVSSGGLDSAAVTSLIDSNYVAARATAATSSGFVMYNYNATSGQTAFQDSDTAGNVLSYTADGILVYYNGLLLADEDYTATDGSAVTLTDGADSGAQITIGKWNLTGSGSSGGGSGGPTWYGDRGLFFGGQASSTVNDIQYIDINTSSNTTDFGDLTSYARYNSAASDGTYGVHQTGTYDGGPAHVNTMDYVTIATPGNATDFGDMTLAVQNKSASGDGTYGYFMGGYATTYINNIDYVTIATPANAADYGDLTTTATQGASCSNGTYTATNLGNASGTFINAIDYFTNGTPGNSSDFGDLTQARFSNAGVGNETYGIFAGGYAGAPTNDRVNTIDYITIDTPGNATDFGDLTIARNNLAGVGNNTYGVFGGGIPITVGGQTNTIDYITIASTGNASDFGDLNQGLTSLTAASGSPS